VPQAPQIANAATQSAVLRVLRGRLASASKPIPSGQVQGTVCNADVLGAVVVTVRIPPDTAQVPLGIVHVAINCGAIGKPVDVTA
jgi:hypothetical protein